jgi:hypothetical protein
VHYSVIILSSSSTEVFSEKMLLRDPVDWPRKKVRRDSGLVLDKIKPKDSNAKCCYLPLDIPCHVNRERARGLNVLLAMYE